jgi:hypothetical protein
MVPDEDIQGELNDRAEKLKGRIGWSLEALLG